MANTSDTVIFCDFDGTVTMEDTFFGAVSRLTDPAHLARCSQKLKDGEMSLYDASQELIATIPSAKREEVLRYGRSVPIRPGFSAFLEACQKLHIPVVIISGGIRWMQEELLKPYLPLLAGFHSCEVDTTGTYMRFYSDHTDGQECMCKTEIMDLYPHKRSIVIGDGFADLSMARRANMIFARADLIKALEKEGRSYIPWQDFTDILEHLTHLGLGGSV